MLLSADWAMATHIPHSNNGTASVVLAIRSILCPGANARTAFAKSENVDVCTGTPTLWAALVARRRQPSTTQRRRSRGKQTRRPRSASTGHNKPRSVFLVLSCLGLLVASVHPRLRVQARMSKKPKRSKEQTKAVKKNRSVSCKLKSIGPAYPYLLWLCAGSHENLL